MTEPSAWLAVPRRPLKIAALISGTGRTLKNLLDRIADAMLDARIELVVSNTSRASGLRFAEEASIPARVISPRDYADPAAFGDAVFDACRQARVDVVALCGFLRYVPIPPDFEHRVLNIHPALIPSFCGHGYYGRRVHQAVLDYGAKVSGCTVHFVDNEYDHGPIILQRAVPVLDADTPDTLAARVFAEECKAYPEALRLLGEGKLRVEGRRVRVLE
jgi:phosphoribosylglycinamide formyltransferase-1